MIVSQKDQAAVVEMMGRLYLETVKPRTAREVSLEEFMLYLAAQMDREKVKDYQSAIAYQQRRKAVLQRCEQALVRSIGMLEVLDELARLARLDMGLAEEPEPELLPGGRS